jgi:hypothetical protein
MIIIVHPYHKKVLLKNTHSIITIQNKTHVDGNFFSSHRTRTLSPTVIPTIQETFCTKHRWMWSTRFIRATNYTQTACEWLTAQFSPAVNDAKFRSSTDVSRVCSVSPTPSQFLVGCFKWRQYDCHLVWGIFQVCAICGTVTAADIHCAILVCGRSKWKVVCGVMSEY